MVSTTNWPPPADLHGRVTNKRRTVTLVLWGAGGHGAVVRDTALATRGFSTITFVDDSGGPGSHMYGSSEGLSSLDPASHVLLVSIGDNRSRARCFEIAGRLLPLATVIHPSAIVSPSAQIGEGSVIMPRAVINAGAVIGRNSIVNTGAVVEHHCRIGDHTHVGPGSVLCGAARLGDFVLFGAGAVACPGAVIGYGAVVGAGAVVPKSADAHCISAGVPARVIRRAL
jgi:sugar O-acyltransferase (sialic acid O-acetyltransferase NeuD family)